MTFLADSWAVDLQYSARMANERFKNDDGNWQIHTEVSIEAPPSKVWQVLTDFDRMHEWSNQLRAVDGDLRDGNEVTIVFTMFGRDNKVKHTMIVEEGVSFGWSDATMPGFLDDHQYKVVADPTDSNTSIFIQTDCFTGPLTKLIGGPLSKALYDGYIEFNERLKARVESE